MICGPYWSNVKTAISMWPIREETSFYCFRLCFLLSSEWNCRFQLGSRIIYLLIWKKCSDWMCKCLFQAIFCSSHGKQGLITDATGKLIREYFYLFYVSASYLSTSLSSFIIFCHIVITITLGSLSSSFRLEVQWRNCWDILQWNLLVTKHPVLCII